MMQWWQWLILVLLPIGLILVLWLGQRFFLLLTRWRLPPMRFEGKGGFNALQPLGEIVDPGAKHIQEVQEHIREDEDEAGSR
jgi:hypothetical protein